MKFGICILLGPWKFSFGTPSCRFSIGRGERPSRKTRAKSVETPVREAPARAKVTARDTVSTTSTFQLDPQVREDSILALVTLGFPKRQAQLRVDAVTAGTTTEDIIKAALQRGR
jgi:hypothetical protein